LQFCNYKKELKTRGERISNWWWWVELLMVDTWCSSETRVTKWTSISTMSKKKNNVQNDWVFDIITTMVWIHYHNVKLILT
jgi:hypothetical protein